MASTSQSRMIDCDGDTVMEDHDSTEQNGLQAVEPERGFLGGPPGLWVPNPMFQPLRDARQAMLNSIPRSEPLPDFSSDLRTRGSRPNPAPEHHAVPQRIFGNMRHLPPPQPRPNTGPNTEHSLRSIFDPIPSNWPPFPRLLSFNGPQNTPTQPQPQPQFRPLSTSNTAAQAPPPASLFTLRTRDSLELIDQGLLHPLPGLGGKLTNSTQLSSHDRFDDSFQESHTTYNSDHDSYYDSLSDSSNTTHLSQRPREPFINNNDTDFRPRTPRPRRHPRLIRPSTMPCSVCLDEFPIDDLLSLECACQYCNECLNGAFRAGCTNMASFPPRCCGNPLRVLVWGGMLEPEVLARYKEIEAEFSAHRPLYCAKKTCSQFIPDAAQLDREEAGRCPECQTVTCKLCINEKEAHEQWDLRRRICPPEDADEAALYDLSAQKKWRQCPTCLNMVEKTDGCNHMDCVCGLDFCYTCGKLYDEDGACECDSEWDGDGPPDDDNNDEEEEWPDFRAAVDMLGRPTCLHWSTDVLDLDSPEACHGCLRFTTDLQGCNDCHLELCEMCLSNIQGLARINGEVDEDNSDQATQQPLANNPRRPAFPRVHQRQRA